MEIELLRERARASERRLPISDAEVATMSATTSATTGRRYGLDMRVCRTWERSRSALSRGGLVCDAQSGVMAHLVGRRPHCRMRNCWRSQRPGPLPVPGRGPSQVHARLRILATSGSPDAGVAGDARAGATSPHRGCESARRLSPRRPTSCGVPTACGCSRPTTDGSLDLRGRRPLERRVRGLACVQGGEPFRGPRAGRARTPAALRLGRGGRGPRAGATDGPRQPVSVGPLPQPAPLLGHPPRFGFLEEPKPTGSASLESHTQGASRLAGSFEMSPTCARPWPSSRTLQPVLAPREAGVSHANEAREEYELAMPRSANVCPRNRVRYITC